MPAIPTRIQQPQPVPSQIELPRQFPRVPESVLERFPDAETWQRRLDEFWTQTNQALQQAQQQTSTQVNGTVVYNVDRFLVFAGNNPMPMFDLDGTNVRLGAVLVINTPEKKVFIGEGVYADAQTPFYVDAEGFFSLGDSLTWDPETDTLTIDGIINATSGTIGGFEIGADYIRDAADSFGLASTVTGAPDWRFWAGATFANRSTAPVRIREDGEVYFASIVGSLLNVDGANVNFSSFLRLAGTKTFPNCEGLDLNALEWKATQNGGILTGVKSSPSVNTDTYTGLTARALYARLSGVIGTGTIDNAYGIYIDTVSVGTTNWGLYVNTTARNFMAGDLTVASIGATTPGSGAFTTLSATGDTTISGQLYLGTNSNQILNFATGNLQLGSAATYNGSAWVARATSAARLAIAPGGDGFAFSINSGLTIGNTFTPTNVAQITATGLAVTGTLSATSNTSTTSGTIRNTNSGATATGGLYLGNDSSATAAVIGVNSSGNTAGSGGVGGALAVQLNNLTNNPVVIGVNNAEVGRFSSTGLAVTGSVQISNLAGVGTRTVVADASGNLSAP